MSAGITLGPMPFDAVVELAETSSIMRDDRVREESSKEWKSAHQIPGLFVDEGSLASDSGVVSLSGFEVTKAAAEATTQKPATAEETTAGAEAADGVVRLDGFEVLLGESETAAGNVDAPASALLSAAASLETVEPTVVPPRKLEPIEKKEPEQRREVTQPHSNLGIADDVIPQLDMPAETPLDAHPPEPPPSHAFDAPDISPGAAEPATVEADTRDARPLLDLAGIVSEGVEDRAAPTPQIPTPPPPQFHPPIQPWRPPVNRNRQVAIRGCLTLAAVVGVWAIFSLLKPDMEAATFDQYAAIYQEYQTLAEVPDSGSWSEFTSRAKTELDETLPNLEAAAVPGERSKSLLLYAGRDLRTALDLPPGAANPHTERLAGFFEQLNELHASSE